MLAYLVIREGSKWTDVFRLMPGQSVTIGRAPTNQIVVKDERCSRAMPKFFIRKNAGCCAIWKAATARLSAISRFNGDYMLQPGEIIRIGHSQMAFVHDLASAFPDPAAGSAVKGTVKADDTILAD